ncbi:Flagellar basal-body rod protein FlgG [Rickettsia endosymbiont of Cardiosporidium cionae]|nr:Flagellar basal-body rod protein FlgG [Rickettsia endosymbiont of Cardiosporidium cionae]
MHKKYFCVFWLVVTLFCCDLKIVLSNNNSFYIGLSNQIVKHRQLELIANNVANISTPGYQENNFAYNYVVSPAYSGPNRLNGNFFVQISGNYFSKRQMHLKTTDRPLDIATKNYNDYFKLLTPDGPRYTLDGRMLVNNNAVLVNVHGYPYASVGNSVISLPDVFESISISEDGTIVVDNDPLDKVGVFSFDDINSLVAQGDSMYIGVDEVVREDYQVISGAFRTSNVNSAISMKDMIEIQRSVSDVNGLISDLNQLDRSLMNKLQIK